MLKKMKSWFEFNQPLSGEEYAVTGVLAFALKYNIDHFFALILFNRHWYVWDYWKGANAFYLWGLRSQDMVFYASMLLIAIPFLVIGVALTLRRLITLKLPVWLVSLFFIPVLNLPFFVVLTILKRPLEGPKPAETSRLSRGLGRFIPESGFGSAVVAVILSSAAGASCVALNAANFRHYGWGLFVLLPFAQGMLAALLFGYHRERSFMECQSVVFTSSLVAGGCMMAFALEGLICIAMAAPIWMVLAAIGGWVGWTIQGLRWHVMARTFVMLLGITAVPFLMGAEFAFKPVPPLLEARTSVDIQAPPEVVWNHVISFSDLPPPEEWIFKTGLAYPIRARIEGHGVGAMRHCEFSTGIFEEPIQVWNKPSLLRFTVINTPSPMEEMSLYSHIEPPHLHGYMLSRQGQFLLTPLPNGGTRLEGTTWYVHNLWPAAYWGLWSDVIIHQIHMRVLKHIKAVAEKDMQQGERHG